MKLKILATSLALSMLAGAPTLAMDHVAAQQAGMHPLLLAADSTQLEQRSARLQQANGKKTSKPTQRRPVRETNPWWL